jgi:regulator of replication initiation timing
MPKPTKKQTVESLSAELAEVQTELADLRAYRDSVVAHSEAYREEQDKLRADAARYRYLRSEIVDEIEKQQLVKGGRISLQEYDTMVDGKIAEQNLPAVLDALASTLPEPKQEPEE